VRPALLIALLFAASAPSALAASAPSGPIVKDGVEITILPTLGSASTPGGLIQVGLDLEARSDDAAKRLGFRSLRAETSVDCRAGANRFLNAQAYTQPNLKGEGVPRVVSGAWVHPNDDSYMSQVTSRICANAGAPPSAVPAPSAAPAKFAAPSPTPVVTSASLPPAAPARIASPPPVVTAPAPRPAYVAAPPPPAPSLARPSPAQTAAASAPPAAHAFAPKPAPAAQAAVRPAGHAAVAQVAASPDAKDAQRVLTTLHAMITPPLTGSVDPAVVNSAHIFRASVSGFSSMADAQAFCARAAHVAKTCWVHR
jgi:hypothetical protein